MALTFRSTIEEIVAMSERGVDGRERIIVATRDPNVTGVQRWNLELTHPSGWTKASQFDGPRVGIGTAMDAVLAETRWKFKEEGKRGDRQAYEPGAGLHGGIPLAGSPVVSMPSRPPLKMRTR